MNLRFKSKYREYIPVKEENAAESLEDVIRWDCVLLYTSHLNKRDEEITSSTLNAAPHVHAARSSSYTRSNSRYTLRPVESDSANLPVVFALGMELG